MNKIFKVVWSKVKHCYVVVSEIAKNTISGGARRCRVRKGALAAALVTAFLSSSFAMPNSAWAAAYDMGTSYEALIVLSAKEVGEKVQFGIELWRGDVESARDDAKKADPSLVYYNYNDKQNLPSQLKGISGYYYTKVSSVGANATFDAAIEQTVINQIISSVENGKNIKVTEVKDASNEIVSYKIDAVDTKNKSVTLNLDSNKNLVVSVTENDGTTDRTISSDEINLSSLDTDTYTTGVTANKSVDNDKDIISTTYATNRTDQDGNAITYTGLSFKEGANIDLELNGNEITISSTATGTGSNYSWIAKDNHGHSKEITTDANELSFVGTGAANVTLEDNVLTVSATDTHITNLEQSITNYNKEDKSGGVITTTITTNGEQNNVYTRDVDISPYVKDVVLNEAKNATYITNTEGTKVTIGDQITDLTNTVNAGWIAKITNNSTTVDVKTITPQNEGNYLNFIAGENVTLENENGAIKINASLNSGGSSEIDLNAGENIKLENNNQNGSITIIADIKGEGYKADWQQQRLMASAQDDSGQEVTGKPPYEYEGQLTELRIGSKVYSVPVISVIDDVDSDAPLLKAIQLDKQNYSIASTDFRLGGSSAVTDDKDNVTSYAGAYEATGNKVELNVYDAYAPQLGPEKITINGIVTTDVFNALNFRVIKTTTGTGETAVTTNKLGLIGSDGADKGSVEVTTAVGSGGYDATITFGGKNGFTLDVGSTVRANSDEVNVENADYLEKISVNGTPYKVLTLDEIKNNIQSNMSTINNLSVNGGEVSKVDNAKHGWEVTDSNQKDSNQNVVVYKDTTLLAGSSAKTTSEDGSTNTYKVQDTAGNVVTIDDVASAEYVNEKFDDIEGEIDGLDVRVTAVEKNISQINKNINAAKTEVKAGESGNVTVTTSHDNGENGDGHTIYTIDTKNTVTSVEAGNENITVEPNIDGDNRTYKISAKNTVNSDMSAEWDNDNVIVAVKDSDGNVVSAPIENVAKAGDLKQEVDERKKADATLAQAIINNQQDVHNLNAGLNKLGNRMNKVGAGAAALAALHPMDFDPDDKLQFSAGVGHYGGENAAALGAFYRPTEKVMFSVAGTMGNGEDMVNAGVTFALDKPNNVSNSRVAMAREIQDLRQQVAALTMLVMQMASRDNAALAGVAMFPDVPENHWAYDYIEGLQKQGIIEGYPDGNFGGDRSMTRYEFAAMLYRALEKGFPVDSRLLNEFNAELGRIRVDRIKGADNDANKVERVRVNNYEDRDDYGSKIVQVKAGA